MDFLFINTVHFFVNILHLYILVFSVTIYVSRIFFLLKVNFCVIKAWHLNEEIIITFNAKIAMNAKAYTKKALFLNYNKFHL